MALYLGDGQLGTTAATLLGAAGGGDERHVAVTLFNRAAADQEVVLRVTRAGSTARQIVGATLKEGDSLYLRGVPLDPTDVLSGYATGAAAVDYLISRSASAEPFTVFMRDAIGAPKISSEVKVTITDDRGLTAGEWLIASLLEECRDLLQKIA